jgi:hypothetical protein
LVIIAVLALCASACGKSTPPLYTRQATSACLQKAGHAPKAIGAAADFVANSATGGAFHVTLPGNGVTVSFGQTLGDADNIDQAYRQFHSKNVGIDDVLRTQGNAVMLWHEHPSDADIAAITGCLKS